MKLVWIFITIGGTIGGYLPILFGDNGFSGWSILTTTIGSLIGLYIYRQMDLE